MLSDGQKIGADAKRLLKVYEFEPKSADDRSGDCGDTFVRGDGDGDRRNLRKSTELDKIVTLEPEILKRP